MLLNYKTKTNIVFSSFNGEIKTFRSSLEAIDYDFARTNYQLKKSPRLHRRW